MSEEVNVAEATPKVTETASVTEAPVSGDVSPDQETKAERVFTQAEVDALLGKRLSQAERKWQRENQREQPKAEPVVEAKPVGKPTRQQFANAEGVVNDEAWADAVSDWNFDRKMSERSKTDQEAKSRQAQQTAEREYQKRADVAREKHEDFDDVVTDPGLPITDAMAFEIRNSELGPDIAYYLGTHKKEADRIARLHPLTQAKELGKIEAKLASDPEPVKTSTAPDPIKPLATRSNAAQVYDTTDPRATKSMTTSEWIKAERLRQEQKWKAAHG